MPVVYQTQSLQMEWCLECHRRPENMCGAGKGIRYELEAARRSKTARFGVSEEVQDSN
jgi:hypothetical protein